MDSYIEESILSRLRISLRIRIKHNSYKLLNLAPGELARKMIQPPQTEGRLQIRIPMQIAVRIVESPYANRRIPERIVESPVRFGAHPISRTPISILNCTRFNLPRETSFLPSYSGKCNFIFALLGLKCTKSNGDA
jgi:hypothetical protein